MLPTIAMWKSIVHKEVIHDETVPPPLSVLSTYRKILPVVAPQNLWIAGKPDTAHFKHGGGGYANKILNNSSKEPETSNSRHTPQRQ